MRYVHGLRLFMPAALLIALVLTLLCPTSAQAQPSYSYGAFLTELNINADGSLLVHNKVTYEFQDSSGWVGLFIPASYGTLQEARVLGGDGAVLPESSWDFEENAEGYTIWCEVSGAGPMATFTYEYLLNGAFVVSGDRVGIPEWGAVPAERDSPIDTSSVTLRFPAEVDTSLVDLEVNTVDYSGQITKRFVGNDTAIVEAAYLSESSSYSVSCYWPAALMDLSGAGFATPDGKSWNFERFDVDIQVNPDSSFTVRETQVANFHGSFSYLNRDLSAEPPLYDEGRRYGRVRIHDIAVYDLDGQPYDGNLWHAESYEGGKRVHIEFQAQDEQRGWIIEYRMTGDLIFAADYDRLYWDTASVQRDVPIKLSAVTVRLPEGTDMSAVETTQYIDIHSPPSSYDSGRDGDTLWWSVKNIPAYTTFSIDVAFPKGVVGKPWQYGWVCGISVIVSSSFLLAAVFLLMILQWWRKGRDVGRTGATMVRYDPPQGLTPAVVGMLVNEKPRIQDISATIVDLARRGYLTIIEQEQRSFIRITKYAFQRTSEDLSGLLPYEREIMEGLFSKGNSASEDDLKNSFYVHVDAILNKGVKKEVMDKGLFTSDPQALRKHYLAAGILVAAVPLATAFVLPRWFDLGWFAVLLLSFIPVGIVVSVIGWAMPRRSKVGSQAYEYVLGFKEYLETAEKPELEYMTPERFQENLPYAMVLEVADAWARKFQEIYTTPPQWYSSTAMAFNTVYLTAALNNMSGNLSHTLTSSPGSSGSGSGGGFGGGSAGGGGGGGGSSAG